MFIAGKQILLVHPAASEVPPVLRSLGRRVSVAHDGAGARELAGREEFDMALVDTDLAGDGAAGVVARLRRETAIPSILILAAPGGVRRAIRALGEGADDYLVKPLERTEVVARVGRLLTWQHLDDRTLDLQKELTRRYFLGNLVSRSAGMRRVRDQILQVAAARSTVLVLGESGVGKELVAKAIHYNSSRREAPFIAINCAAIPTTLIETELFGHERGAFTGAVGRHKGKFELADGGTIFLDEVGEMDLGTQAKLLRVLEERALMRVGGGREIGVDVRVLAATNGDLEQLIARGRFREDLYFRLKVITISVPPLRDRREDIPDLARTFLEQIRRDNGFKPMRLTDKAIRALRLYSWPGNVRELKNVLESTAITHPGATIRAADLPAGVLGEARAERRRGAPGEATTLEEMERDLIRRTLARHAGNRTHAARALRIGLRTLQRKIKAYGVHIPSARGRRPAPPQRSTETPSPGLPRAGRT
ncbi:MAG: sigma-54-dependent Fis family transcriptional regulator [Acidobacteria bacterium]|nr:sigma-54-dependent Fis family transcriptional regulator [Acidobacteriota bacterium]